MKKNKDRKIKNIAVELILSSPYQPRRTIPDDSLKGLSDSIRENGLLQPITLRDMGGRYQLIAGERRLLACKLLGEKMVQAIIIEANPQKAAILTMVENLQRENLHFLDEALGIEALIQNHGLRQTDVAKKIGISQSATANKLRILKLPPSILTGLKSYHLTERHGRALLRLRDERKQLDMLRRIVSEHLTVRQTDEIIDEELSPKIQQRKPNKKPVPKMQTQNITRIFSDWRLISNTIEKSVDKMREAGANIEYSFSDLGEKVKMVVTMEKYNNGLNEVFTKPRKQAD